MALGRRQSQQFQINPPIAMAPGPPPPWARMKAAPAQAGQLPSAGAFALIGAVALLGGIQRSSVSLVVIILEGTGEVQFVLPIILTTVCARCVGNLLNEGVYEMAMEQKHKIAFTLQY